MKKILIVEDYPDIAYGPSNTSQANGFCCNYGTRNGKEGVATIAEKPDLIMMDFMMPEIHGWAATRMLRAITETKEIPIIAVTAMIRPSDQRRKTVSISFRIYARQFDGVDVLFRRRYAPASAYEVVTQSGSQSIDL